MYHPFKIQLLGKCLPLEVYDELSLTSPSVHMSEHTTVEMVEQYVTLNSSQSVISSSIPLHLIYIPIPMYDIEIEFPL